MKKVLIGILTGVLLVSSPVSAKEEIEQLYAQSAVLMDADNGRVLFEKNGSEKKPGHHAPPVITHPQYRLPASQRCGNLQESSP